MMLGSTLVLKVMVAGDGGVGKTTFIRKFVSGSFDGKTAKIPLDKTLFGGSWALLKRTP